MAFASKLSLLLSGDTASASIHQQWLAELRQNIATSGGRISEAALNQQTTEFLRLLAMATQGGNLSPAMPSKPSPLRDFLEEISRSRAVQGFSFDETATFIFSLKRPLFAALRAAYQSDADGLAEDIWAVTELLDALGLHTARTYQRSREDVINRQQQDLLEISTPVVKLWDGILALPVIGTLDSARTQVVMETLLQRIVETEAELAIIDITGVPTVDTLVAQHLLKTVTAIRLMGADCIISGIRPQIAQTIVHLGVELGAVATKATLADAFALAMKRVGLNVARA
ncbi:MULTISPECIES: STAS domain-containing protein [Hydrocarboniphaga]|jgi:rsbT co-antagonist protein RsbR|uniref:Anti-sigma-factor antagonist n=1 Tax=Hydrocarboniphaga effusa AP103 TaxID=1172194 RepID=I8HWF5_9GAMM|nr:MULTISPECIES: STAS domain-containing protein [Hydrocarboniphaga]EIT67656.1 Anti-sigma-factor antagonist [Hydrocarboniphaga effusa AP103]MDZ4080240.1 STAS domain-containing protein [Hydrocarboniphaga sp.]